MKRAGKKIKMVTAYDYPTGVLVDKTEIELILVGDSLGMVVLGYDGTVPVTMDDMIHHIRPVVKGAPNTFIVGDMPFMSYNISKEDAIYNAGRIMKEGGAGYCRGWNSGNGPYWPHTADGFGAGWL